jgi:hypothetical protein
MRGLSKRDLVVIAVLGVAAEILGTILLVMAF